MSSSPAVPSHINKVAWQDATQTTPVRGFLVERTAHSSAGLPHALTFSTRRATPCRTVLLQIRLCHCQRHAAELFKACMSDLRHQVQFQHTQQVAAVVNMGRCCPRHHACGLTWTTGVATALPRRHVIFRYRWCLSASSLKWLRTSVANPTSSEVWTSPAS